MEKLLSKVPFLGMLVSDVALSTFEVIKRRNGEQHSVIDQLAEEVPVALIYNGISHAVMLATPQDLEDFALGFSLSEGIVKDKSELYGIEIRTQANGIELYCDIASECFAQLKDRRRTLAGRTGCGLCGSESLEQAIRYPKELKDKIVFQRDAIQRALHDMPLLQNLQQQTGATHASAWVLADGTVSLLREDVGRHNALDKLIGAIAKSNNNNNGFIITSSRASYEMVQKTASAGVNMLVAISAPTGLAVRVADQCGLTLVGFAREDNYVVYSHPENLVI
ncbi:formate dehydrogenase accessory sulfurtransferase FdhD [Methylotenera sp.]|uniref:formate dehydrogenase accessory sulfurtransferase FdhD n=1 Tax=Methylotenera sp. TaxID=2051956 RepID=UPI002717E0C9|nr:formate dehydrogenase accessory sulfurtransferase FdhD [Methylotenera sp.]MDO9206419.1 formate dehydrogenase accessory sulfurtransferase FdhD [Methylotenera sp.]MDP3818463.1 formate dehydrogenase accessory sulfurtransferase FdhD [Methylotenera sp.]